jgi:hypothetical protein
MEPQGKQALNEGNKSQSAGLQETCQLNFENLNPAASTFPVACCGVSERMGNDIAPCGSKILRSLLRRAIKAISQKVMVFQLSGCINH